MRGKICDHSHENILFCPACDMEEIREARPDMVFRVRSSPNIKGWQIAEGWSKNNCEEGYCFFEARGPVEALEGLLEKVKLST